MRRQNWLVLAALIALPACSDDPMAPCSHDGPPMGVPALDIVGTLRIAGAEVVDLGERFEMTLMSTPARELLVNDHLVLWHEYCLGSAAGNDARRFSDDASSFDGVPIAWSATPHIYTFAQVILIYEGDDAELLTLLTSVMGAPVAEGS